MWTALYRLNNEEVIFLKIMAVLLCIRHFYNRLIYVRSLVVLNFRKVNRMFTRHQARRIFHVTRFSTRLTDKDRNRASFSKTRNPRGARWIEKAISKKASNRSESLCQGDKLRGFLIRATKGWTGLPGIELAGWMRGHGSASAGRRTRQLWRDSYRVQCVRDK